MEIFSIAIPVSIKLIKEQLVYKYMYRHRMIKNYVITLPVWAGAQQNLQNVTKLHVRSEHSLITAVTGCCRWRQASSIFLCACSEKTDQTLWLERRIVIFATRCICQCVDFDVSDYVCSSKAIWTSHSRMKHMWDLFGSVANTVGILERSQNG